jgi:O-antigen/teichoic acid export membrane protein
MREEAISTLPAPADSVTATAEPAAKATRAQGLVTWGTRGGLALADQGLFAGAHFLLNILLARWLTPADYGAFALGYSVFLLVSVAHSALLLEPMAVFGSGKYLRDWRRYLGILLRGHLALTAAAAVLVLGAAKLAARFEAPAVQQVLLVLAPVIPVLLLVWLTRRAFYFRLLPGWATAGSAVYFAVLLVVAVWLYRTGKLTLITAILAMALAAAIAAAVQLVRLRPRWSPPHGELTAATVAADHWQYGRWALASAAAMWVPLNIYYLVLPAWGGLEAAGALKALMNLANPVLHSLIAFGMLLVPLLVRHRDRGGIVRMRQTVRRLVGVFLLGSAVYFVVLWQFHAEILQLLYGGKYLEYGPAPFLLLGAVPLLASLTTVLGSALRALERPDRLFWCYLISSAAAVFVGTPLTAVFGLTGALAGILVSYVTGAVAMGAHLKRTSELGEEDAHG